MDIFSEIKRLRFSLGEYVVVGSGIMDALGIKKSNDIDIVVMPSLFEKCKRGDWESIPWTHSEKIGQIFLRRGNVELYSDVNKGNSNPTTKELINESVIIDGVPFISLERCIAFKRAYGHEKHLKDIALIEEYLQK